MFCVLFIALVGSRIIPDTLVDDSILTIDGLSIMRPTVALNWNGDLYIGDENAKRIFVRRKDGTLVTIGKPGHGPGEFVNHPENLFVKKNVLVIEEWNRWREYYFDQNGTFINSRMLEPFVYEYHGKKYRKLLAEEAIKVGFLYEMVGSGGQICQMISRDYEGLHQTRGSLKEGPNQTVVAFKKSGEIEVYGIDATKLYEMKLPMEPFKKKMVVDAFSSKITQAMGGAGQAFSGGIPLLDGAVASLTQIWVLCHNENLEDQYFLFEVDVIKGQILSRTDLDQPFTRITLHQGVLALVSPDTSTVMTYRTQ